MFGCNNDSVQKVIINQQIRCRRLLHQADWPCVYRIVPQLRWSTPLSRGMGGIRRIHASHTGFISAHAYAAGAGLRASRSSRASCQGCKSLHILQKLSVSTTRTERLTWCTGWQSGMELCRARATSIGFL